MAQLNFSMNSEYGFSKFGKQGFDTPVEPLVLMDTRFGYFYKKQQLNKLSVQLGLRPEIYKSYKALKLFAKAGYNLYREHYKFTVNIMKRKNMYTGKLQDIKFDSFILQPALTCFINPKITMIMNTGYINQIISRNLSGVLKNKLDMVFVNITFFKFVSGHIKIYPGIYVERFFVNNHYISWKNEKCGWRLGPEIGCSYLKRFTTNITYRFLQTMPELVGFPFYEHHVQFLFGRMIGSDWSIFFLTDYYFRHFDKN